MFGRYYANQAYATPPHLLDNLHFDHFVKIIKLNQVDFDEMVEMEIVQQMGRSGIRLMRTVKMKNDSRGSYFVLFTVRVPSNTRFSGCEIVQLVGRLTGTRAM